MASIGIGRTRAWAHDVLDRIMRPPRPDPPAAARCTCDESHVDLDLAMLELRSWLVEREADINAKVDRVTVLVTEVADHVR